MIPIVLSLMLYPPVIFVTYKILRLHFVPLRMTENIVSFQPNREISSKTIIPLQASFYNHIDKELYKP